MGSWLICPSKIVPSCIVRIIFGNTKNTLQSFINGESQRKKQIILRQQSLKNQLMIFKEEFTRYHVKDGEIWGINTCIRFDYK